MSPLLIVDDDAELRKALSILLDKTGVILQASNGPDAMRQIKTEKPKLMLLDIAMPEMGGIAVLKSALKIDPSMAVLMLTAECDIEIAKSALELGARAYFTKPFDGVVLLNEVEYIMEVIAGGKGLGPYRPWRVKY